MFVDMKQWIVIRKDSPWLDEARKSMNALLVFPTEEAALREIRFGLNGTADQYEARPVEINLVMGESTT